MHTKQNKYNELVLKRKKFKFSDGLLNPSMIDFGQYDCDEIGAWSQWQGNHNAEILVVGQDWGDIDYFINNHGKDSDDNPTNNNLIELFNVINIDIGLPSKPNKSAPVFFTNSILGIKTNGKMSGKVSQKWAKESTQEFLLPLIELIKPKVIITLGAIAYKEISKIYGLPTNSLTKIVCETPKFEVQGLKIYPRFHCGRLGIANRNFELQKQDWYKIYLSI